MHDSRLEDLLRRTLRDEAEALTLSITTDVLQRRLAQRQRQAHANRRWLVAAAIAAVALTGGAALLSQVRGDVPPIGATPSPSASPRPLPEAAELLADYPEATLRLEHSVGPAAGPATPESPTVSTAPGPSPTPVEIGRVKFVGAFVIAVACIGEGELVAEVSTPSFGFSYTQAHAPCNGQPVFSEYLADPIDPSSDGDTVRVTVSEGASWRLAVGEYPASLMTPPEFEPIELTPGWSVVANTGPTLVSTKTGARVTMPDGATRAGVFVQCQGAPSLSISVPGSPSTEVGCEPGGATRRIEFPAVGGEPLALGAAVDKGRVWVRIIVEADAEIASTYPSAPPLPAAMASVPYAAPDASVVGFGTLGSDRQTILQIGGARPGLPAGDLLPVAIHAGGSAAHLDLISISGGTIVRNLATAALPAFIFDSWADATHGAVFYGVARETGIEFHRVSVDGSDDRIVATVEPDPSGFTADLSVDDAVFVVDACHPGAGCVRTVVDAATGTAERTARPADPICKILGIVDGLIVGTSRADCSTKSTTALIAVPIEGGSPKILMESAPIPEIGDAVVVSTSDGAKVVYTAPVDGDGVPPLKVLDVRTGGTTDLPAGAVGDPPLFPYPLRLPAGWVLLAGGMLGDFPWQRAIDRPAPVLVDLVTGERIELVNLPHWTGNYPS